MQGALPLLLGVLVKKRRKQRPFDGAPPFSGPWMPPCTPEPALSEAEGYPASMALKSELPYAVPVFASASTASQVVPNITKTSFTLVISMILRTRGFSPVSTRYRPVF